MGAILRAAAADYKDVVKTTVLLADIGDFAAVNTIYGAHTNSMLGVHGCWRSESYPWRCMLTGMSAGMYSNA